MSPASPAVRYRLKVSLRHISPMVWRRLVAPSDLTLHGLHRAIQIAFGWEDDHLHAFKVHGRYTVEARVGQRPAERPAPKLLHAPLQGGMPKAAACRAFGVRRTTLIEALRRAG